MKILIDTNIYLDFYRSQKEAIIIIKELINNRSSIILTDQIIQEFDRSREAVIKTLRKKFDQDFKLEDFSSSFLQNIQEFKQLIDIHQSYRSKKREVNNIISDILEEPFKDPIAVLFKEFVDVSLKEDSVLSTTDEIISRAQKRKLIGNPPTSDKYSIGDEINWEIVLENVKEDIIIVGRDNTYSDNLSFLKKDFHKNTGRYINGLTDRITVALQKIGIQTTAEVQKAEDDLIKEIQHYSDFWKSPSARNKEGGSSPQ